MKRLFLLLAATCICATTMAQNIEYQEPEFDGDAVVILADLSAKPLVRESFSSRSRPSTGSKLFGIGKANIAEIVVAGAQSPTRLAKEGEIAFIVRVPNNEIDPLSVLSIFEFECSKKRRQAEYASIGMFGELQSNTLKRLAFTARKFGRSSYLITLREVRPGEFGIALNQPDTHSIATFGISK